MSSQFEAFRQSLIKLNPNGEDGFEGLMSVVLTELTRRSFVLASSGSQNGRDGQSALDGGAIVFEAKRYDGAIHKDQLLAKITDIAADPGGGIELFIVGATTVISAQIESKMREAAKRFGLFVLSLAWSNEGLPTLAAILGMAPEVTLDFLARHTDTPAIELRDQLSEIRSHSLFADRSVELKDLLDQPSIAPAYALQDNVAYLQAAFSDMARARSEFGQALSPQDPSNPKTVDRLALRTSIAERVFKKRGSSITAILGQDGNGKSWIFAQTWAGVEPKPLTVVIVPSDIPEVFTADACEALLLHKLLRQTQGIGLNDAETRWKRHFLRWRKNPDPAMPRLVVFVDGINQRDNLEWLRFLDTMASVVQDLGGNLAFSCRRGFFNDYIRGRLNRKVNIVDVPEWTDGELNDLLALHGTSIVALDDEVVRSLRNPRIFGVAAKLFKTVEIRSFKELSVTRLLFEHVRSGMAAGGAEVARRDFAAAMCGHARTILQRIEAQETEDLTEFDRTDAPSVGTEHGSLSTRKLVTAAMRFFEVVDEDPNKYVLKDEGLPLALGLAVLQTARGAARKKKSVEVALSTVLDPIAALDRTSDILLGAILAGVIEGECAEIVGHLVSAFVRLQNLPSSSYPEFRSLFGRDPAGFFAALELCALSEDTVANPIWLIDSVKELRSDPPFEAILGDHIRRWLSMYSLAPNPKMLATFARDPDEYARAKQRETERITQAIDALSPAEAELLSRMQREERGSYSELGTIALQLLAGRRLAPYAESLRNWCLATALNRTYMGQHHTFESLLHFNVADWMAARIALKEHTEILRAEGVSTVGKWALVLAMNAGGDSDDVKEASLLCESLQGPQKASVLWRRVENYCATDPCDPNSTMPENFGQTVQKYAEIDLAKLYESRTGRTTETMFFEMARPGMARFAPQTAVDVMRRLADHAHTRPIEGFNRVVRELDNHAVCLDERIVDPFISTAAKISQRIVDAGGVDKNEDGLFSSQAALCAAFPHMSGSAQLSALLAHPGDKTIFMDFAFLFEPVSQDELERAMATVTAQADVVGQFRVLVFADYSGTPLTAAALQYVGDLHTSTSDEVRFAALSLICSTEDPSLLERVVKEGWSAACLDVTTHAAEIQHGSRALVLAAAQGLISIDACLDRIAISEYGVLVEKVGRDAVAAVAERISRLIDPSAAFKWDGSLPPLEQRVEGGAHVTTINIDFDSTRRATTEAYRAARDLEDAWHEELREDVEAAESFSRVVQRAGAHLVLEHLPVDLIAAIDGVDPAIADGWAADLIKLDERALRSVHNFALVVAQVIASRDESVSLGIFARLSGKEPFANTYLGSLHVRLDRFALWSAARAPMIQAFLFDRLDRAGNDRELALEVVGAIEADRTDVLKAYVLDRRDRVEPAHRARAAMVAGLAPDEPWATETVGLLRDEKGFLGDVYTAATYAMERHQWSLHWANEMRLAADPISLWRGYVLLSKIVDGRFAWSALGDELSSPLVHRFFPTFRSSLESRARKWKEKRKSTLFGRRLVDELFLRGPKV